MGVGVRGFRDGPSCGALWLMALGTDGSPSSSCVSVTPCAQATFQKCALQSQVDLKREAACTRQHCSI